MSAVIMQSMKLRSSTPVTPSASDASHIRRLT
jgi:hypothetical protein